MCSDEALLESESGGIEQTQHHHHDEMPEGEEAPPPGARLMAALRWALILGMTVFAAAVVTSYYPGLSAATAPSGTLYHCPMHPTYTSDKPGECPICGMNLVLVAQQAEGDALYQCPMHPEEVSTDPESRCPKCGMRLEKAEPKDPGAHDGHEDHSAHQVPGLATVAVSAERTQLIGLRTGTAAARALGQSFGLVGYVVPDETRLAHVHTRLSGWIEKLHVNETGQRVKKGDPLFTLFSRELYQAEREFVLTRKTSAGSSAQGSLAEVARAARRRLELLGLPADEIERLEKNGEPQEAVLFRSPLSGHVLEKGALEGKYVTPGTDLYIVADLSRVWVLAEVFEQHISRVVAGQKASLAVDALPGRTFEGKVTFLYPTLSPQTRTLRVRLEFDNADLALKPGMYGKVRLQLKSREVLSVPEEAVVNAGHHQYAFVARPDGHFEPRLVSTGIRADEHVEILSGLSEGERVVTSAGFFIDSESRLKAAIAGLGAPSAGGHAGH
jgi:membrane fusion protein, copper/silver efflux system